MSLYAVLDYDRKTVVGVIPPDANLEQLVDEINGRLLIEMTLDNTPAGIGWIYDGHKFISPEDSK